MVMYHQTKFGRKRISSSEDIRRYSTDCHTLITLTLAVAVTLKIAHQSFFMTLWLTMMHPQTKFW